MSLQRVQKGDKVAVIAGKYRGQVGEVAEVLRAAGRVRILGVALVRRHLKPNSDPKEPKGGIVERLGSVHLSNVQPVDPKSDRPTRVGTRVDGDGRRVRYAKLSGEPLPATRPGRRSRG